MSLRLNFDAPGELDMFAGMSASNALRWYQEDAYAAIMAGFQSVDSQLLLLATGLGKTTVASAVVRDWDGPVLWLANRDELVQQARRELEEATGSYVEVEQATSKCSSSAKYVVGSLDSVRGEKRLNRLGHDRFSLVVFDEAHLALAPTYRKALEWFHCKRLLLTATPDRSDEKPIGAICDSVAYVMDIWDGVEAGYLVPVEGQRVFLKEIDLENVHTRGGDLVASELDEAMLKAVEGICVKTLELYPDRNGLAFFPGVRSAEYAMQRFNALKPGSAVFVDGKTDDMERRRAVEDFRKGRVQFLCNCLVFTTGFDAPATDLIIQGRPTGSRSLYTQMLGRGTRVLPGTVDHIASRNDSEARRAAIAGSKKPNLVVLDFVGNSGKHSLMGPEDALGGSFTEDEVALAKKISKRSDGATNAREVLLKARRELMMKAMGVKAKKVDAEVHPFDPFKVLGVTVKDSDRYTDRFGLKPMSEGQRSILELKGVPAKELATLSFKAASKLIENLKDRQKRGLCTYKQLRLLQKFGINDTDVTFDRATAGVTYIKAKGWGSNVDGRELAAIIHHRRQAGED